VVEPISAILAVITVVALAAAGWLWQDRLGLKRHLAEAEAHRLRTHAAGQMARCFAM
jgi:hypothetical protein